MRTNVRRRDHFVDVTREDVVSDSRLSKRPDVNVFDLVLDQIECTHHCQRTSFDFVIESTTK